MTITPEDQTLVGFFAEPIMRFISALVKKFPSLKPFKKILEKKFDDAESFLNPNHDGFSEAIFDPVDLSLVIHDLDSTMIIIRWMCGEKGDKFLRSVLESMPEMKQLLTIETVDTTGYPMIPDEFNRIRANIITKTDIGGVKFYLANSACADGRGEHRHRPLIATLHFDEASKIREKLAHMSGEVFIWELSVPKIYTRNIYSWNIGIIPHELINYYEDLPDVIFPSNNEINGYLALLFNPMTLSSRDFCKHGRSVLSSNKIIFVLET